MKPNLRGDFRYIMRYLPRSKQKQFLDTWELWYDQGRHAVLTAWQRTLVVHLKIKQGRINDIRPEDLAEIRRAAI